MSDLDFEMDTGVDLDATTDVEIVSPKTGEAWRDDKGAPVTVSVISSQSDTFKRRMHEIQKRYRIKAKNNTGPNKNFLTFAQEQEFTAEVYAAIMAGWHITKADGGPAMTVPFTEKNAINWCKANPLFAQQLSGGSDDLAKFAKDFEGNFTSKGSGPSTKPSKAKSD